MSINELGSINQAYNIVSGLNTNNIDSAKKELESLFSQKFYNSSDMNSSKIDAEIKKIEAYIAEQEKLAQEYYNKARTNDTLLNKTMKELNDEISKASNLSKENISTQQERITSVQNDVYSMYAKGEIEKDEVAGMIAERLMGTSFSESSAYLSHVSNVNVLNSKVKAVATLVAEYLDEGNSYKTNIQNSKTTLGLLNSVGKGLGNAQTSTPEVPKAELPSGTLDTERTNSIGFNLGNNIFEFVLDKNSDGIFNNKTELLGSQRGFEELLELDKDQNGVIENGELDELMVLKSNFQGTEYSFLTATAAGIKSVDLNALKQPQMPTKELPQTEDVTTSSLMPESPDIAENEPTDLGLPSEILVTMGNKTAVVEQSSYDQSYIDKSYSKTFGQNFSYQMNVNDLQAALDQMAIAKRNPKEVALESTLNQANQDVTDLRQTLADDKKLIREMISDAKDRS